MDLHSFLQAPEDRNDGLWVLHYARKCQVCGVHYRRDLELFTNPSLIGQSEAMRQRYSRCGLHPHAERKMGPAGWARIADNG
jgi:hypothetical protein